MFQTPLPLLLPINDFLFSLSQFSQAWERFFNAHGQGQLDEFTSFVSDTKQHSIEARRSLAGLIKRYGDAEELEKLSFAEFVFGKFRTEIDRVATYAKTLERSHQELLEALLVLPDPIAMVDQQEALQNEFVNASLFECFFLCPFCLFVRLPSSPLSFLTCRCDQCKIEVERWKGKCLKYEEEFTKLTNQDITIRELEKEREELREEVCYCCCCCHLTVSFCLFC